MSSRKKISPDKYKTGRASDPWGIGGADGSYDPGEDGEWQPVSGTAFGIATLAFFYMGYLLATHGMMGQDSRILYLLHQVNLVFHEFGHPAFSFFGRTMAILGGTLGQLLVPLAVAIAFWKRKDSLGLAFGAFWFFENFLDVAVYMEDAKYLRLQLIGGLGMEAHDWRNLFLEWDVILHAVRIANITATLGWLGIIGTWLWLGWRWLHTDNR